ncbi:MAG: GGDEF domain-containing protein [Thermoleophilia bacterium]
MRTHVTEDWTASGHAALMRGLRAVRVALSLAFAALVLTAGSGGGAVALTHSTAMVVAGLACANSVRNLWLAVRPPLRPERPWVAGVQLVVDTLLALVAALMLDPTATPLAWVALLIPVLGAGAAFGPVPAAITWLALGLAYVGMRLNTLPTGTSGAELVRLALQQLAAVAIVAVPAGYMAARLRDDLDRAHHTLTNARRRTDELELVADHSRQITTTVAPEAVLRGMLQAVVDLGFTRAEVCQRDAGGTWRTAHVQGEGRSPAPTAQMGLERSLSTGEPVAVGHTGDAAELQWLHLSGFADCLVLPIWSNENRAAALRVWSAEPLPKDDTRVQALRLLVRHAAAAWQAAIRYSSLAGWSRLIAHEAAHDGLTGLANRAHMLARLSQTVEEHAGGGPMFAVLYLDLDGFKGVNDSLGHRAGDDVLVAAARRLATLVRPGDLVARMGGDEFVMLLTSVTAAEEATRVADRVCIAIGAPIAVNGTVVHIGISAGIALGEPNEDADALLRRADAAMYQAKRRGKNGYAVAPPPGIAAAPQAPAPAAPA